MSEINYSALPIEKRMKILMSALGTENYKLLRDEIMKLYESKPLQSIEGTETETLLNDESINQICSNYEKYTYIAEELLPKYIPFLYTKICSDEGIIEDVCMWGIEHSNSGNKLFYHIFSWLAEYYKPEI